MYEKFSKRILWIDVDVVPGAMQMNTAWYYAVPEKDPVFPGHCHPDDELIGFLSSDPKDPHNLDAEIEVEIDGERQLLTRSTLVFIPGGVPHISMRILRVGRPVFHFSIVTEKNYEGEPINNDTIKEQTEPLSAPSDADITVSFLRLSPSPAFCILR